MDDTDTRLVAALLADGRLAWPSLGRTVGLSGPSVQERVKRLEERGVITGYRATVDAAALGLGVSALVDLFQHEDAESDAVADAVAAVPEVEDCWFVAGDENFVVKVRAPDVQALESTIASLRRLRGVSRTRTTVVLSTRWEGRAAPLPGAGSGDDAPAT
ncbi:AsnC family transcriptional regulator [Angustibacter aerolatus]|uniref:AsnC family transcriptional regulator n=1 Tax=Angustibacter aerolatus TaxID=1162965 RepID=A0ABQ6JKC6_9ACTN|nr:Lrp/AsnC family transcriptional regulator [Angustibacter aerolatus]GMA87834.1 AsnC family transcriptional regulator [Angustibacter aerolatus]